MSDSNAASRAAKTLRRVTLVVAVIAGAASWAASVAAQTDAEPREGIFSVQRIEISFYGGYIGGATYLELPPLGTPLTNDTALDLILDYRGQVPSTPVQAPKKVIESGWKAGGTAAFHLTPNFGMALFGEYGAQEAVFTGRRVIDEVLQPDREEIDRTTMTSFAGGAQIVYHVGRERKYPVRPLLTLGFGGILNRFPDTDDVGALYLKYGVGLSFPVASKWRGFVTFDSRIFTWETDEVALNSTLQFPGLLAGLTWRYFVPEDADPDPPYWDAY